MLTKHPCQSTEYIANANPLRANSLLDFPIALFQPLACCAEYTICDALGRVAILFNFMYAVCEEIDVRFERLAEVCEM